MLRQIIAAASVSALTIVSVLTAVSAQAETRCVADKNASVCHTFKSGKLTSSTMTVGNNKPVRMTTRSGRVVRTNKAGRLPQQKQNPQHIKR